MMRAENTVGLTAAGMSVVSDEDTGVRSGALSDLLLVLAQTGLVCVLIGGVYFAWPWLSAAFDKPIARVVIRGELQALSHQAVKDVVAIYQDDSFLGIDLTALVNRLEAQPWISLARARRRWPDTVEIDLVEQHPIAYWGEKQMVNSKGRVFDHQGMYSGRNLPRLWSELGTPADAMSHYEIFARQLQPLALGLRSISQNMQGDWQLLLSNGMTVMLDRTDPSGNVHNFVDLYRQLLVSSDKQAVVVDMRYRHGAAIRWQQT